MIWRAQAPLGTQPIPSDSGILVLPSTAFLRPPTTGQMRLTHKRSETCLRLRYAPHLRNKRANTDACQLCSADTKYLMHQCGACRHPKVHAITCLRHKHAIPKIALALKQCAFGDAYLFMTAEGHQRFRVMLMKPLLSQSRYAPLRIQSLMLSCSPPSLRVSHRMACRIGAQ